MDSRTKYGKQNYKALTKYYREYLYNFTIRVIFLGKNKGKAR